MIWLASYPRSGNTFMRNLFFDVFGMESASWPVERSYVPGKDYKVTKTHMLPDEVPGVAADDTVIYLVRDGRDAIVSNAHYRRNFIDPGSDLLLNMRENILAMKGSYFGGWSANAIAWSKRANLIIRFEDLTRDPEHSLEQIRKLVPLPPPDYSKIKTFDQLKHGTPQYGSGGREKDKPAFAKSFFHKGTSGQFKSEMPDDLQELFWNYHGDVMKQFGYTRTGELLPYNYDMGNAVSRCRTFSATMFITRVRIGMMVDSLRHRTALALKGHRQEPSVKEIIQKPQQSVRSDD